MSNYSLNSYDKLICFYYSDFNVISPLLIKEGLYLNRNDISK